MPRSGATRLKALPKREADFIGPMECASVSALLDGPNWLYEIKLDGYRAIAVKADGRVNLFSRRRKSFDHHYPLIVQALGELPEGTVVDGEVVALDESGGPNFNLLQSFRSEASRIHYFIFDLLICEDRDLTRLPLIERRSLMKSHLKLRSPRVRIAEQFEATATDMLAAVRQQQLEGVIGKRRDSLYEPGKRTGSWVKYRVNQGHEFVIGGYIPGPHGFDSLIVGYYRDKDLVYVARVRNGFVPASRRQVFEKIRPLVSPTMPFVSLPDTHKSRWGDELTAEKMHGRTRLSGHQIDVDPCAQPAVPHQLNILLVSFFRRILQSSYIERNTLRYICSYFRARAKRRVPSHTHAIERRNAERVSRLVKDPAQRNGRAVNCRGGAQG